MDLAGELHNDLLIGGCSSSTSGCTLRYHSLDKPYLVISLSFFVISK